MKYLWIEALPEQRHLRDLVRRLEQHLALILKSVDKTYDRGSCARTWPHGMRGISYEYRVPFHPG